MSDGGRIGPGHHEIRMVLRIVGPAIGVVGLLLMVVGIGSFFSSFGSFEPPRHFWCAFLGMPLLAVGVVISKFAFMGTVARYMAGEVAPVAKDTFNYMAGGVREGVKEIAGALSEGIKAGAGTQAAATVRCHKCNEQNAVEARFCNKCGAALQKTRACPSCVELNDPDARFCDNCGRQIG